MVQPENVMREHDMPGEVIFEFYRVGAYVKVSAVDPATMTEISIVGDPQVGEEALKRAALRKLMYRLRRDGRLAPAAQGGEKGGPQGFLV